MSRTKARSGPGVSAIEFGDFVKMCSILSRFVSFSFGSVRHRCLIWGAARSWVVIHPCPKWDSKCSIWDTFAEAGENNDTVIAWPLRCESDRDHIVSIARAFDMDKRRLESGR